MKSKNLFLFIIFITLFQSCNLKQIFEEIDDLNNELKTSFNHENIDVNLHWGTEENENYMVITFSSFNLESINHTELEKLSNRVIYKIIGLHSKYKKLDFIQVQFTEEDEKESENYNSITQFKMFKEDLNY